MACDTCVEITQLANDMAEENIRLKRTNKILRTVNTQLRRLMQQTQAGTDDLFLALCETDKQAELALGELWGSGEFDCGPQDYECMVERCLEALREYNESRKHSAQI